MSYPEPAILMTVDVEDWFQVENFKQFIPFSSWPSHELRVEKNTYRILDLFDSIEVNSPTNLKATFFVLGWVAERLPRLVREIHSRGHEVGSHGYYHGLGGKSSSDALRMDLIDSKKLLEDIVGDRIYGYRAPSFSINNDMLRTIEDCGYLYDSSYNSFGAHDRYGRIDLSHSTGNGIAARISDGFYELPVSNIRLGNCTLPWGGGGYFRLAPASIFRLGVRSILKKEKAYLFYMHPWEIDPYQPKVTAAPPFYRFRHYVNLKKTLSKLVKFLMAFNECPFITCHQYLKSHLPSAKADGLR